MSKGCCNLFINVEEKVVVIHRGRCRRNNEVHYRLSHDVVT